MTKQEWMSIAIGAGFTIVTLVIFFFLISCEDSDGCTPEETRCEGPVSQICNADRNWEAIANCLDLEPGEWACCAKDRVEGCNLVEECD